MLFALPSPSPAQVRVLISGGFSAAYREILPQFEKSTGITVNKPGNNGISQSFGAFWTYRHACNGGVALIPFRNLEGDASHAEDLR